MAESSGVRPDRTYRSTDRPDRPRLDDVASRAGVSTATASLVLRDRPGPSQPTRERVLSAAADLGYRADRSASLLARRRTHLLGVTMSLTNPFHAELVEDIHLAASERGYDVVVSPLTGVSDEWHTALRLVDQRCEAAVLLGPALTRRQLESITQHTPVVVVGRRVSARGVAVVRAADDKGVAAAVKHLTGLGHQRIAFVDGPPGPITTLRREGFRRAMRRLTGSSKPLVIAGGDTEMAGMQASLPRGPAAPTAYIAFNDRCALGVVDQLRNAGRRVPDDVSVVGFDNSPVARLQTVALTTVSQSPVAMSAAVVDAALDVIEGGTKTTPPDVVLDPPLVVRSTSGPVSG
jgi:DNA-binding LacI/PurR family transcriptional regulator